MLAYLRRQGGELFSTDGRGITGRMAAALGYKLGSLGRVLSELEHEGVIEREIRGKRTYRIRLREMAPVTGQETAGELVPMPEPVTAGGDDILTLLVEIGVLERRFEETVQHIERLRVDVEMLMERCRQRMGDAGPVTIDLRTPRPSTRASSNGSDPLHQRPAAL